MDPVLCQPEQQHCAEMSPTTCSSPVQHGDIPRSPRSVALSNDSGIGQVFFPPDFDEGNVSSGLLSPVGDTKMAKSERSTGMWKCRWKRWTEFLIVWILIFLFAWIATYGSITLQALLDSTQLTFQKYTAEYLPYCLLVVIFVCSCVAMLCSNNPVNPPQRINGLAEIPRLQGVPDHGDHNAGIERNSQLRGVRQNSRDFPCSRTFSGTGSDVWHQFRRYFENLAC